MRPNKTGKSTVYESYSMIVNSRSHTHNRDLYSRRKIHPEMKSVLKSYRNRIEAIVTTAKQQQKKTNKNIKTVNYESTVCGEAVCGRGGVREEMNLPMQFFLLIRMQVSLYHTMNCRSHNSESDSKRSHITRCKQTTNRRMRPTDVN